MARTYPAANDGMSASALSTLSIRSRFICNRFYTYSSSTLHYVFLSQLQSQKYTFLWYESTFNYFYYLCLLFEEYHVCFLTNTCFMIVYLKDYRLKSQSLRLHRYQGPD